MAQEVTLMGATYSDVPSVLLPDSNNTLHSFVDTSDATATASEILSGYTAYSNGTKVTGTASSGGSSGYTRTVIAEEQTVTPVSTSLSGSTYYGATLNISDGFEASAEYIITLNGIEYFFTCQVLWGTNYLLGDINYFYGGSGLPYPFGIIWTSGTTCTLARDNGNQVTVKIEKLELSGSGGATLITKTITENGTYLASDDSADGYSSVTVNVSGGASNIVTGTFKGTTTGAAMDVDLAYTGNGYPVAIIIYPKEGAYNSNSSAYALVQRYASLWFNAVKSYADVAPNYDNSGTEDRYTITNRTKNSTSSSTNYGTNITPDQIVASGGNAAQTVQNVVKLKSKTKMSVYIASSAYGFAANIDYTYHVIYSS